MTSLDVEFQIRGTDFSWFCSNPGPVETTRETFWFNTPYPTDCRGRTKFTADACHASQIQQKSHTNSADCINTEVSGVVRIHEVYKRYMMIIL